MSESKRDVSPATPATLSAADAILPPDQAGALLLGASEKKLRQLAARGDILPVALDGKTGYLRSSIYAYVERLASRGATRSRWRGPEYLDRLPAVVPADRVLAHNHVRPTRRLGSRGFRAWLSRPGAPRLEVCGCGFAPELGEHFRVIRIIPESSTTPRR